LFIACVGKLIGVSAFAETSDWDRFALTINGYELPVDTRLRSDMPHQRPATILDLRDDLQVVDSPVPTQYDASLDITQQISLDSNYFEPDSARPIELTEVDSPSLLADPFLGWNLTTSLQFTLTGDDASNYYGDFGGTIIGLRIGLRYNILENVGFGGGYDMLDVNAAQNANSWGLITYRQRGPMAFMSLRF